MKKVDTTNVTEAGEYKTLPAGAYICVIRNAEDIPDKEQLAITYDVAAGEYKGYYDEIRDRHPDWTYIGRYTKSYKPKALPFFKRFCTAISKSNGNFVFDGGSVNSDERTLIGKKLGLMFGEEEYYSNSGDLRTRLYVAFEFSADKINEQKIPAVKRIKEDAKTEPKKADTGFIDVPANATDDFVPFD